MHTLTPGLMESQWLQCLGLLCGINSPWIELWGAGQVPPKGVLSQRTKWMLEMTFLPLSFPEALPHQSSQYFFPLSMVQNLSLMTLHHVSFHPSWKKNILNGDLITVDGRESVGFI